jgi:serine/threonine-protein kinase
MLRPTPSATAVTGSSATRLDSDARPVSLRSFGDATLTHVSGGFANNASLAGTVVMPAHAASWPSADGRGPNRGSLVGKYRLIELIGLGAEAMVWRAECGPPGPAEVALKIALPGAHGWRRRAARLAHEAARGRRVRDPALLTTLEFGDAAGMAYLAMPLVRGCTLQDVLQHRQRLAQGQDVTSCHSLARLPLDAYRAAIVSRLVGVVRGLHRAHQSGIAHRDIKPANILIDSENDGAYLADFGLARDLDVATLDQLRDGEGTPIYMAPEKIARQQTDEVACDVFAMGVTLFEALTLERLFWVPSALTGLLLLAYMAKHQPRARSLRGFGLPRPLEAIVRTATHRDPSRRFRDAEALADAMAHGVDAFPRRRMGVWRHPAARAIWPLGPTRTRQDAALPC